MAETTTTSSGLHVSLQRDKNALTTAGRAYANTVIDPFGQGSRGWTVERYPDGDDRPSFLLRLNGRASISTSSTASGIIQLMGYSVASTTKGHSLALTTGADALSSSATMTAIATYDDEQGATVGAIGTPSHSMRCLRAGIRILPCTLETATGKLFPFVSDKHVKVGSGVFQTNGIITGAKIGNTFTASQGLVVRRGIDLNDMKYRLPPSTLYSTVETITWGAMPGVVYWGMSTTENVNVEWEYVMEVLPFRASPLEARDSGYEPNLEALAHVINSTPWFASGNSFKSLLSATWRGIGRAALFALENPSLKQMALAAATEGIKKVTQRRATGLRKKRRARR